MMMKALFGGGGDCGASGGKEEKGRLPGRPWQGRRWRGRGGGGCHGGGGGGHRSRSRYGFFQQEEAAEAVSAAQASGGGDKAAAPLVATFVKDITAPDRSLASAGASLVKTWAVKNAGSTAWPQGCKLIFLRGDRGLLEEVEEFPVPCAAAGQTVEVSALLKKLAILAVGYLVWSVSSGMVASSMDHLGSFDPYATLGVSTSDSLRDVKKAYRALSMKWHPDKNKDETDRELVKRNFMKVNKAFKIINKEHKGEKVTAEDYAMDTN